MRATGEFCALSGKVVRRAVIFALALGWLACVLWLSTAGSEVGSLWNDTHVADNHVADNHENHNDSENDNDNHIAAPQPVEAGADTARAEREFVDYVIEYEDNDLRRRLSQVFPYTRKSPIPNIIWQTWKQPLSEIRNTELRNNIHTWESQDSYEHRLIIDDDMVYVITRTYEQFPDILDAFIKMPLNILKYDFFRYLILFAFGGIYTDIDTYSIRPLKSWIDQPVNMERLFQDYHGDVGFLAGIEGDLDSEDWSLELSRRVQFCQWTFKSKAGHPVLRELIYRITQVTNERYDKKLNHVKIGSQYYNLNSIYTVMEWTGPGVFTDAVFHHLNKIHSDAAVYDANLDKSVHFAQFEKHHSDKNTVSESNSVGWQNFTRLTIPVLFDDVLILPANSFNGLPDVVEFEVDGRYTYLNHEFQGSWKG